MGLFKTILNSVNDYYNTPANTTSENKHSFTSDDPPGVWKPLLGMDLYDTLGSKSYYKSFAYACINKKAYNLSKAKVYLYRTFKSKQTEITDHPFLKLINSQNQYKQSFKEMMFLASVNCDINGYAYLLITYVKLPFGKLPVSFTPLPARYMTPMLDSQNEMIEYYYYGNSQKKFMPDEIIRFKVPSPDSNLYGHAPVSAFNFTLDIDYLSARTRRAFFDNDARPTLAVQFPTGLEKEVFDAYVQKFNSRHVGASNNGKVMVTDNGAKIDALNTTGRELDYVNSREQILEEIELILDVNQQVMGRFKDSNYNNSRNALNSWVENSLSPYADMIFNEKLTAFVKDNYDQKLITVMEFDTQDPDFDLKIFQGTGPITDNEKRRLLNYDDSDDPKADELYHEPVVPVAEPINN